MGPHRVSLIGRCLDTCDAAGLGEICVMCHGNNTAREGRARARRAPGGGTVLRGRGGRLQQRRAGALAPDGPRPSARAEQHVVMERRALQRGRAAGVHAHRRRRAGLLSFRAGLQTY
jgi:hypothetical protein